MEKFLIVDIEVGDDFKEILAEKFGLTIFDAKAMTNDLLIWQGWRSLEPRSTLIVLPGNGASIVKKHIDNVKSFWLYRWPWKAFPYAKRVWVPGENPQAFVGRINQGVLIGIKTVVVIDDVISSGETIRKLRKENESFIPNTQWQAITWVMQEAAITNGYSSVFAVKAVGSKERKVPINSLSTLVERRDIAESYARRNFGKEAEAFLKIIESFC